MTATLLHIPAPDRALAHRAAFYRDLANGIATIEAACAWIRAEFDEQAHTDLIQQTRNLRNRNMGGAG